MDEFVNGLNIVYLVSLASIIDVTLTYYILWLDEKHRGKKNVQHKELNILAAGIMRLTKNGPWGLLFGALLSQAVIWGATLFSLRIGNLFIALQFLQFTAGALFVVIWIHTYHIGLLHKSIKARKIMGLDKIL